MASIGTLRPVGLRRRLPLALGAHKNHTEQLAMTTAKFSEILNGYESCAFGDLMDTQAFLSLERGTVHIVSGDMELDEEPPEDFETGPYLALPDKSELQLGKSLAIEFTEEHLPNEVAPELRSA